MPYYDHLDRVPSLFNTRLLPLYVDVGPDRLSEKLASIPELFSSDISTGVVEIPKLTLDHVVLSAHFWYNKKGDIKYYGDFHFDRGKAYLSDIIIKLRDIKFSAYTDIKKIRERSPFDIDFIANVREDEAIILELRIFKDNSRIYSGQGDNEGNLTIKSCSYTPKSPEALKQLEGIAHDLIKNSLRG